MGLLDFLFGKKAQKIVPRGPWLEVNFSDEAVNVGVGGDANKCIYHYYGPQLEKTEAYTRSAMEHYARQGIFVVDRTQGHLIPPEASLAPKTQVILGTLRLHSSAIAKY